MRSSRFRGLSGHKEEMSLQITPMADVFTILLVFLLKSFSVGVSNITPSQDLILPEAKAGDQIIESLKIEVSETQVLFDEQPVTPLKNYRVNPQDVEADGTIRSLNTVLLKGFRKPAAKDIDGNAISGDKPPILIMADEKVPYRTLYTVLTTVAKRGYPDFKLVVVENQ